MDLGHARDLEVWGLSVVNLTTECVLGWELPPWCLPQWEGGTFVIPISPLKAGAAVHHLKLLSLPCFHSQLLQF